MCWFATEPRRGAHRRSIAGLLVLLASLTAGTVAAQADPAADRAARRMQQQVQRLQQQVQDLQSGKLAAEAARATAEQGLKEREDALAQAQVQARRAKDGMAAGQTTQAALGRRVAELERQLADQARQHETQLAEREQARARLAKELEAKEADRRQFARLGDERGRQLEECSSRNERLVTLATSLADRYRRKGVWDALRQSDPLIGLRDVDLFNEVQDLRDKADAERYLAPNPVR